MSVSVKLSATANSLFSLSHLSLDVHPNHLDLSVGANGNRFLKMSGEFALAVLRYLDRACLPGLDGFFGVCRNGAATAGDGLVDNQRLLAYVGKGEYGCLDRRFFAKGTKIVYRLIKLNLCLVLLCVGNGSYQQHDNRQKLFHILLF